MNDLSVFLKENRKARENVFYCAGRDIKDSEGNIVKWEIRPISTSEEEKIREECTDCSGGRYKLNVNRYIEKMIAEAVVFPNLYDAKLQDSYGVKSPEALVKEILDEPGDYSRLAKFVQELNGFKSLREDIEEAKN